MNFLSPLSGCGRRRVESLAAVVALVLAAAAARPGLMAQTPAPATTVPAGGWLQINSILRDYGDDTTQGYVRIRKISGNNPFLAYGVINDGASPGERSGDGAYVPARE